MKDKTVYLIELDGTLLSRIYNSPEDAEIGAHTLFETVPNSKEANIIVARLHDSRTTYRNNKSRK